MYFIHQTYTGMIDACAKKTEPYVCTVATKFAIRAAHENSLSKGSAPGLR